MKAGATVLYDAPGPRATVRNWVITGITVVAAGVIIVVVLAKLYTKGQLTAEKWRPFMTADLWQTYVLPGVQGTLTAAALSIVLALILGVLLGVGRMSTSAALRWISGTVVEFFRAVPVLIMMIFAYFLYASDALNKIPLLSAWLQKLGVPPVEIPSEHLALAGVVTGLTLYNGAVIAEIVRAGVNALPRGQSEAAAALGLRNGQTMRLILLPQAITAMLPALVSQVVVVLKDTAIGYQITFVEMVRQGQVIGSQYQNYLPALVVIAVLMIAVNVALSWFAVWLEARLRRSRRGGAAAHVVAQQTAEMEAGA